MFRGSVFLYPSQKLFNHVATFILRLFQMKKYCIHQDVVKPAVANPCITQQIKVGLPGVQIAKVVDGIDSHLTGIVQEVLLGNIQCRQDLTFASRFATGIIQLPNRYCLRGT